MKKAAPAAPARDSMPRNIAHFEIQERLGKGAMGVVYRALDRRAGREVALKVVVSDLEGDAETRARFFREAEAIATLSHRNVVGVIESGEEGGKLYIAMELLRGCTLTDTLKRVPALDLESRLDVMLQVGHGLIAAHNHGVYHRDIKPANLFVCEDGSVKILDFGVARLAGSSMTITGYILGTPDFMSPEQARGGDVDDRSDIFSAAAVFYLMLTGRKPFAAPDLPAVLHNVLRVDPLPICDTEAPAALATVIEKALSKDAARRQQSAGHFVMDLCGAWRTIAAETRERAGRAAAAARTLKLHEARLAEQRRDLNCAAGTPDRWLAITEAQPALARGESVLEAFPLRRAVVETISRDVNIAVAEARQELSVLESAAAAVASATESIAGAQFDKAVRLLTPIAQTVPGSATVTDLLQTAKALAAQHRQQEGERLAALEAERVSREEAAAALRSAAEQARVVMLAAAEEADQARRVEDLLKRAAAAGERKKFDRALALVGEAQALAPLDTRAVALHAELETARTASDAERHRSEEKARRERAAAPALREARKALAAGEHVRVRWAAENALAVAPGHPEARALLATLEAAPAPAVSGDDTVSVPASRPSEDTARLRSQGDSLGILVADVRTKAMTWWRRVQSSRGQTTTEYLMIAAVLTAVGALLAKIVPAALVLYFQGIAASIASRGI